MNPQLNLFASRQARDKGIAKVSSHHPELLNRLREIAKHIAKYKAEISIDDVKQYCHNFNIEITHPNLCGAVFKGGDFECCGFAPSKQVSRHAGLIRLWRLK